MPREFAKFQLDRVMSRYGAPMGRRGVRPSNFKQEFRLYLYRVFLDSGGYDTGGAYWGVGTPLYRYHDVAFQLEGYCRGSTREQAKHNVRLIYPNVRFWR